MSTDTFTLDNLVPNAIKIAKGLQDRLFTPDLSATVKIVDNDGNSMIPDTTTIREITQLIFVELGMEIAFSGRGENEKGVIIDMDESRLSQLGLNPDALKFGQTVVKINPGDDLLADGFLTWTIARPGQTAYTCERLITEIVSSQLALTGC
jgi:GDP-D-mannose dehydratase